MHPAVSTTTRPNDAAAGTQPVARIDDERWVCHIGLDAEASGFFNDLYQGAVIDEARRARLARSATPPICSKWSAEAGRHECCYDQKRRMGGS